MTDAKLAAGFEFGMATDAGRKRRREPNQDSVSLVLPGPSQSFTPLLIVADGMGGYRGGEIASRMLIEVVQKRYCEAAPEARGPAQLVDYINEAHRAIRAAGQKDARLGSMGTTVVAAMLGPSQLDVINVGDSRLYLVRGRQIVQLSQDHSIVAEQVRLGLLTAEQARTHPKRSHLSMSISAKRPEIKPFIARSQLEPDDAVVLCSDGLWSAIPDALIWAAASELSPQDAADKLVDLANRNQGPDNISVIVARRFDPSRQPAASAMQETNPGE